MAVTSVTSGVARGPALGVLELDSVARGVVVADAALKRAPALLVAVRPVSAGKLVVLLEGGVAEVAEAMAAGRTAAGARLVDQLELAAADAQVWAMLPGLRRAHGWADEANHAQATSVAIVETQTVAAALGAADVACKTADVVVRDVRLAVDLAGRAFFTLTGALPAIEAAADAVTAAYADRLIAVERIAQPVVELWGALLPDLAD